MLDDSKSDLGQKLLSRYDFAGIFFMGNISKTINTRRYEKSFFGVTLKVQSIDISF